MTDTAALARRMAEDAAALVARADAAERAHAAGRAELAHVLGLLPYEDAKSGKYRKLRLRLERFLSERIEGL